MDQLHFGGGQHLIFNAKGKELSWVYKKQAQYFWKNV